MYIAVNAPASHHYRKSAAMRHHTHSCSFTFHAAEVTFRPLSNQKMYLIYWPQNWGWKAEITWAIVNEHVLHGCYMMDSSSSQYFSRNLNPASWYCLENLAVGSNSETVNSHWFAEIPTCSCVVNVAVQLLWLCAFVCGVPGTLYLDVVHLPKSALPPLWAVTLN